jgi:hypothetical protein
MSLLLLVLILILFFGGGGYYGYRGGYYGPNGLIGILIFVVAFVVLLRLLGVY